jgi:putative Mn2+ efflux pump MntP
MSVDAMTVNATNGLNEKGMRLVKMILISFSFGFFQFMMPTIGYFVGYLFRDQLTKWIPWIAFALLLFLGLKSFIDWLKEYRERKKEKEALARGENVEPRKEKTISFIDILVQSIATSIDALCIGFVYMSYSIPNAMIVFSIIGITTFVLSFLCVFLAKQIAGPLEKWAGLIAALVFVGIGIKILLEGIL